MNPFLQNLVDISMETLFFTSDLNPHQILIRGIDLYNSISHLELDTNVEGQEN